MDKLGVRKTLPHYNKSMDVNHGNIIMMMN